MKPQLTVFADATELGRAVAQEIGEAVEAAAGSRFVLGCPGGRSPMSTYVALSEWFSERDTDLSQLVIAMMDDYVLSGADGLHQPPADAHYSCRRFAREEIQARLNAGVSPEHRIPDEHVWGPEPADPAAYESKLEETGVDYFILASGAGDGHVAFNPPGSPLDSTSRVVELAEQTRIDNMATFPDFESLDEVPHHGVTVGVGTIARVSRRMAMLVVGSDKREAVRRLLAADGYDPDWPATVYLTAAEPRLYVDRAAIGEDAW
jgi:glucosamine-6-phosphate deaminase